MNDSFFLDRIRIGMVAPHEQDAPVSQGHQVLQGLTCPESLIIRHIGNIRDAAIPVDEHQGNALDKTAIKVLAHAGYSG